MIKYLLTAAFLFLVPISASMAQETCNDRNINLETLVEHIVQLGDDIQAVYSADDLQPYLEMKGTIIPIKYEFVVVITLSDTGNVYIAYFNNAGCQVFGHIMGQDEVDKFENFLAGI